MTKEQIEEAAKEYSGLTDNPKDSDSRERGSNIFVTKRSQLYSFISSWLRFLYIREYHLKPIVPNIKAENGYFFGYAIFHPRHKN